MPQFIADQRDIEFNLYELFNVESLCRHQKFKFFDKAAYKLILAEAREFALKDMLPVYQNSHGQGAGYREGRVRVPECFHRVHRHYCENLWTAPASDQTFGGQGLPSLIAGAIGEYMMGSNWSLYAYGSMGAVTGNLIQKFGSRALKETYVRKLYTGQWGGSILHTESWAGTDLGALSASATRNPDGSFSITGNNIYITNGDHDLCENIIHTVPARIQGDPEGVGGLSMFIVPKFLVREKGEPKEPNNIVCTGIEKKHGLHGSATCAMSLGAEKRCIGFLLGRQKQGAQIISAMMNQSRLNMGLMALAFGSSAYLYALNYARNRIQGGILESLVYPEAVPAPIIRHPDVKQKLMQMKAMTQGLRTLIYFAMSLKDQVAVETDSARQQQLEGLLNLIIPLIKGYGCEQGYKICVWAIQVFGGVGYLKDYQVESIARDCKITTLFEGSTETQAMELLGLRLLQDRGQTLNILTEQMNALIDLTRKQDQVKAMGHRFNLLVTRFGEIWALLENQFTGHDPKISFAYAPAFMKIMGEVCMGWMLLWRADVAETALGQKGVEKSDQDFYISQIKTARYFFQAMMPVTLGRIEALADFPCVVSDMEESDFGAM